MFAPGAPIFITLVSSGMLAQPLEMVAVSVIVPIPIWVSVMELPEFGTGGSTIPVGETVQFIIAPLWRPGTDQVSDPVQIMLLPDR